MITELAIVAKPIADIVSGFLTQRDRDKPDKEKDEFIQKLQNFFANNALDTDDFRLFIDELFLKSGTPLLATGNPEFGRRELLHTLLLNTIQLIHERRLASRAFAALTKPN